MSLRGVTHAHEFMVQVSLLSKVLQKQEKVQLNYKSTKRNNLPNTLHLSKHLTELNKERAAIHYNKARYFDEFPLLQQLLVNNSAI